MPHDRMFWKFRLYGFLKNLRFFDPFLILFLREMGLSFLEIGALYSIREISTNLLEIPTGVLADAFGRRKAMLASFSAYIASFALFYALPRFWIYAIAMILFAVGETFRSGTHKAMILEHLRISGREAEKVAYYGRTRAASQVGSAVAALIAGALVFFAGGVRIVFLASIVPYALALVLFLTYPRSLDAGRLAAAKVPRRQALALVRATARNFVSALRRPALLRGLASGAGFDAIFKSTKDYLQPILQAQALALPLLLALGEEERVAIVVGGLYFLVYLGTAFASSQAGQVERRLRSLPAVSNATYAIGLLLLAAAGASAWVGLSALAIALFLLVYAVQNLRRPVLIGYLANLLSRDTMATGLSVETQLRTLLMAGLAPLLGVLADRLGVGAAVLTIAAIGLALFPLVRLRQSEP